MNRILLLIALALLSSGCRKALPSPDYIEASNRYTSLLVLHGDDAFSRPEMDEVNAQLGRVLPKSSDYTAAQALIATIASERQRVATASAKAAIVAPTPTPVFPDLPQARVEQQVVEEVAKPPPTTDEFGRGALFAPLVAKYPGCLLSTGSITLLSSDGGSNDAEGFELHDSAHCRTRIPVLVAAVALVQDGKIAQLSPRSALKVTAALEDGGSVPAP